MSPRIEVASQPGTRSWTPRTALSRALEVAREDGARALWFRTIGELAYRRLILFEADLGDPLPPPSLVPERLGPGDIDEYSTFRPGVDSNRIRARLETDEVCFFTRVDGRIAHAYWSARGRAWIEPLGYDLALAADEDLGYEAYTAPELRGRGIATAVRIAALHALRAEGFRRSLRAVEPEDGVALRLSARTGFRPIGRLSVVWLGRHRHHACRVKADARPPGAT
jgi:GNAT superfamily N-acetyltransferase